MIVGVESNFVLELAFRQEEAGECRQILSLAEQSAILLAIPACALFEPYETLIRRSKARDNVAFELERELQQLARTESYAQLRETSKDIAQALSESCKEQAASLASTIDQIVGIATVIPLDSEVIKHSLAAQRELSLPPQDSVVFASIIRFFDLQEQDSKLFANKNTMDFAKDPIADRLAKHNCKLLPRFGQARRYIESTLPK
jgi:hypothetical protein